MIKRNIFLALLLILAACATSKEIDEDAIEINQLLIEETSKVIFDKQKRIAEISREESKNINLLILDKFASQVPKTTEIQIKSFFDELCQCIDSAKRYENDISNSSEEMTTSIENIDWISQVHTFIPDEVNLSFDEFIIANEINMYIYIHDLLLIKTIIRQLFLLDIVATKNLVV